MGIGVVPSGSGLSRARWGSSQEPRTPLAWREWTVENASQSLPKATPRKSVSGGMPFPLLLEPTVDPRRKEASRRAGMILEF